MTKKKQAGMAVELSSYLLNIGAVKAAAAANKRLALHALFIVDTILA